MQTDIHCRLKKQYEDMCALLQRVGEWHVRFQIQPMWLNLACLTHTENQPDANAEVEHMIWEHQQVSINEVVEELKISHGSEHQIIHKVLQYRKVPASLVPTTHPSI